jgi:7,8-dihydro-6-hydroxymethylpterin-pyrophosphokinase
MKIERTSAHSGITRTLDLDVTLNEYASWRGGELIQNAMPRLNADDREFIMTGITAEEWKEMFPANHLCQQEV